MTAQLATKALAKKIKISKQTAKIYKETTGLIDSKCIPLSRHGMHVLSRVI